MKPRRNHATNSSLLGSRTRQLNHPTAVWFVPRAIANLLPRPDTPPPHDVKPLADGPCTRELQMAPGAQDSHAPDMSTSYCQHVQGHRRATEAQGSSFGTSPIAQIQKHSQVSCWVLMIFKFFGPYRGYSAHPICKATASPFQGMRRESCAWAGTAKDV